MLSHLLGNELIMGGGGGAKFVRGKGPSCLRQEGEICAAINQRCNPCWAQTTGTKNKSCPADDSDSGMGAGGLVLLASWSSGGLIAFKPMWGFRSLAFREGGKKTNQGKAGGVCGGTIHHPYNRVLQESIREGYVGPEMTLREPANPIRKSLMVCAFGGAIGGEDRFAGGSKTVTGGVEPWNKLEGGLRVCSTSRSSRRRLAI